ncbi:carbohydrate binding domain-containing protein [Carboxylicivirga sp. M1479]|uniref:carbohydrate binding domain-containing protein n=1 Tax=Carboxylicivirga sp. M1479 TaxID=2594476 RepID=UPI001178999D|nr:carbohydrate binding domain-containing protein [Carboxylicivirga sp. M1479]TRX71164.1 hypothetical protein FNN09_08100 [Carboxylicivirga sp. M1479]
MRNLSALLIVFFSWTITLSAQNLLTNGNFESGNLNDWNPTNSVISNTELAEGGQYCAKVRVSSKTGWIYQQKELVAGKTYRYSGYVKIGEVDKQYFFLTSTLFREQNHKHQSFSGITVFKRHFWVSQLNFGYI